MYCETASVCGKYKAEASSPPNLEYVRILISLASSHAWVKTQTQTGFKLDCKDSGAIWHFSLPRKSESVILPFQGRMDLKHDGLINLRTG